MQRKNLEILLGLAAGALATIPMTWAMNKLFEHLPEKNKSVLPPRKIAMKIADKLNVQASLNEGGKTAATLISHYAYGATMGGLYSSLARKLNVESTRSGILFGLAVWVGSYLGYLPALKIHRSALKEPWRRNALMIAAHIIWGTAVAKTLRTEKLLWRSPLPKV